MSDLSSAEKRCLERLFQMKGGYVLNFSNRTFSEFILDSVGIDIYDPKYAVGGDSKANRLRTFWKIESGQLVGKLITEMVIYAGEFEMISGDEGLYDSANIIAKRLLRDVPVIDIDVIDPNSPERNFALLAKSIRDSIDKNQPETSLDRLHTYTIKYFRIICKDRGFSIDNEKPLHSLVGEYLKSLKKNNELDSDMTELILKSSISVLESFNRVRNNQSMAHDNKVLNYDESLLILNHVTSSIKFIMALENRRAKNQIKNPGDENLPF
jgi:hypothetical protein